MRFQLSSVLGLCALVLALTPAYAQEEPSPATETTPEAAVPGETVSEEPSPTEAEDKMGINVELGYASAYLFRGYNVFQKEGQSDQHMLLAPGLSWAIMDTGLTIGYWGAFQITGDNADDVVDAGLGMEQDIYATYEMTLPGDVGLAFGVLAYLYPGADEDIVGTSMPTYIEPSVAATYTQFVDMSLSIAYFFGVQDEPAVRGISYLYVNPSVGKSFELHSLVALDVALSYGFKLFKEGNEDMSNVHDITLNVGAPVELDGTFYVVPSVNMAWTNVKETDLADELAYWGGSALEPTSSSKSRSLRPTFKEARCKNLAACLDALLQLVSSSGARPVLATIHENWVSTR